MCANAAIPAIDRVKLNVGGTVFHTTRTTLHQLDSEYFERLLDSGSGFAEPENGVYFVDRDPACFRMILNIARYGDVFIDLNPVDPDMLDREADFYLVGQPVREALLRYRQRWNTIAPRANIPTSPGQGNTNITVQLTLADLGNPEFNKFRHHVEMSAKAFIRWQCTAAQCTFQVQERTVVCSRCGRKILLEGLTLAEWCHKCLRCTRCIDFLCLGLTS